jgi:hypothetical protein
MQIICVQLHFHAFASRRFEVDVNLVSGATASKALIFSEIQFHRSSCAIKNTSSNPRNVIENIFLLENNVLLQGPSINPSTSVSINNVGHIKRKQQIQFD